MPISNIIKEQPDKVVGLRTRLAARSWSLPKAVVLLAHAATLLLVPFALSQCTPRPVSKVLRVLINNHNPVNLGPYADRISGVKEYAPLSIPVAGASPAGLIIYTPSSPSTAPRPLVLFMHGGGWVAGTAKQLSPFAKLLAAEGFVVASLDYSLAPEHPYPTPIRQAAASLDYLQAHAKDYAVDPTKFFIGGNSAGAQLASQLGAMISNSALAKQVGIPIQMPANHLRGVILYSGPYNFDTVAQNNFPFFNLFAWAYTGKKEYQKYARIDELSTTKQITADYPPTYLTTGDADPFAPQSIELDSVLRAKGVDVTSRFWNGSKKKLSHDYIFDLTTDGGQTALQDVVKFIRSKSH